MTRLISYQTAPSLPHLQIYTCIDVSIRMHTKLHAGDSQYSLATRFTTPSPSDPLSSLPGGLRAPRRRICLWCV